MDHNGRHIPILGPSGAPAKLNLSVQYSPGPLATPIVLPPIQAEAGFLAPAFGGATRMETVAGRLLAGAMAHNTLARCADDTDYRRKLIEAAVLTAWELIGFASEFRGPMPEQAMQPVEAESEIDPPENTKPSNIVLPD